MTPTPTSWRPPTGWIRSSIPGWPSGWPPAASWAGWAAPGVSRRSGSSPGPACSSPIPTTGPRTATCSSSARTGTPPARSSPPTGPPCSTASASRVSSSSTPSTPATSTAWTRHRPAPGLRRGPAHNRAMVAFTSIDRRLLPTCYVPLADFDAAAAMAAEAVAGGAAALLVPSNCPRATPPAPRARPGVGHRPGRRHPHRVPRGRRRHPHQPRLLPQRPPRTPRLPRWGRELPLSRLHGHPRPAHADAGHHDHRRGAGALPPAQDRRDRAGRHLGAGLDAADGIGLRRLLPPRGAAPGPQPAPLGVRAAPDPGDPLPHRGRGLDHGPGLRGRGAILLRLPPRGGRSPPDRAVRTLPGRRLGGGPPQVLRAPTWPTSWAPP